MWGGCVLGRVDFVRSFRPLSSSSSVMLCYVISDPGGLYHSSIQYHLSSPSSFPSSPKFVSLIPVSFLSYFKFVSFISLFSLVPSSFHRIPFLSR